MNELANVRCDGEGLRELALFAGAGGGILGGHLLGWRTVCAVEWEPYAACVLAARQNDGILPAFPIWDDVQTFDGRPWRGIVDVVSGGFPCQDISAAGRGAGIDGKRSGMWGHMARIIGEVRPRYVYVENSPMLTSRGLHRVLGDLAEMGFDARWGVVSAADVGAPHKRDRIWIVGDSSGKRRSEGRHDNGQHDGAKLDSDGQHASQMADADGLRQLQQERVKQNERGWIGDGGSEMADSNHDGLHSQKQGKLGESAKQAKTRKEFDQTRGHRILADANGTQRERNECPKRESAQHSDAGCASWWSSEPDVGRVADGVAARVDRLKAIGNGQVPLVAATAWNLLK